jgi:hypothetical protein
MVTEHGSQDQLNVKYKDRKQRQCEEAGAAFIELHAGLFLDPLLTGEKGEGYRKAEERLCQGRVRGRDRWGQKEFNGEAPEYSLNDYHSKGYEAQNSHPAPSLGARGPYRKDNR